MLQIFDGMISRAPWAPSSYSATAVHDAWLLGTIVMSSVEYGWWPLVDRSHAAWLAQRFALWKHANDGCPSSSPGSSVGTFRFPSAAGSNHVSSSE